MTPKKNRRKTARYRAAKKHKHAKKMRRVHGQLRRKKGHTNHHSSWS